MTQSPARVVAQLAVDLGAGTAPPAPGEAPGDWPVYWASEPDAPDRVITLYDTAGQGDGRLMRTGQVLSHFGLQARVRARTHEEGWAKALALRAALSEGDGPLQELVAVGGARFVVVGLSRFGEVLSLGQEAQTRRRLFTFNFLAAIREV